MLDEYCACRSTNNEHTDTTDYQEQNESSRISFNTSFTRLLLLKIALVVSINTIAGKDNIEPNRFAEMDFSSAYNDGFYKIIQFSQDG
jgi:hypothetical protein